MYQHWCLVKKLLSLPGSNNKFKNNITKLFHKLEEIMGDRKCKFTKELCINYDSIEVKEGGTSQLVTESSSYIGLVKTILWKNLPEHLLTTNTQKYHNQLLNRSIKQNKERVSCLIGGPNSGKTSLFTPITQIIPTR